MLDGLFVTPALTAITEALASAGAVEGTIAVIGHAKLARALGASRTVIPVGLSPRAAKKLPSAIPEVSAIEARSLAAVVGVDVAGLADDAWPARLGAWTAAVRDGGAIVFLDRGGATQASRRALCAGLSELEQRRAGRSIVTSGLVTHL
jgi:hypothetical protein